MNEVAGLPGEWPWSPIWVARASYGVTRVAKREESIVIVTCDGCRRASVEVESEEELPEPWRVVLLLGWVGEFHACGERCETRVLNRVGRPEEPIDEPE